MKNNIDLSHLLPLDEPLIHVPSNAMNLTFEEERSLNNLLQGIEEPIEEEVVPKNLSPEELEKLEEENLANFIQSEVDNSIKNVNGNVRSVSDLIRRAKNRK